MRRLLLALALAGAAVALAPAVHADHCWGDVPPCWTPPWDCTDPDQAGRAALCYQVVVTVDPAGCAREPHWDECALDATCTLDNPPSRCGNRMVAVGFRSA